MSRRGQLICLKFYAFQVHNSPLRSSQRRNRFYVGGGCSKYFKRSSASLRGSITDGLMRNAAGRAIIGRREWHLRLDMLINQTHMDWGILSWGILTTTIEYDSKLSEPGDPGPVIADIRRYLLVVCLLCHAVLVAPRASGHQALHQGQQVPHRDVQHNVVA